MGRGGGVGEREELQPSVIHTAAHPSPATTPGLPIVRWSLLGALLAVEALVLVSRFDAAPLMASDSWWTAALGLTGFVVPIVFYAVAGLFLIATLFPHATRVLVRSAPALDPDRVWWPYLVGHLIAYGALVVLTPRIFGADVDRNGVSPALVAAWAIAGLATVVLWVEAIVPGRTLLPLLRSGWKFLVGGIAVGVLGFAAGEFTDEWWRPLGYSTLEVVRALLLLVTTDVIARPDEFVIGTPHFLVQIMHQCSGYQGIGLIWVFLGGYLWVFRDRLRFPQALLLVPAATALIWLANAMRIFLLIVIGTWMSPAIAVGGFHHSAGALLFCGVALGIVAVTRRWRFVSAETDAGAAEGYNPTATYLAPFLLIIGTAAATGIFTSGGFDILYPLRVVITAAALVMLRPRFTDLHWRWSWTAAAVGAAAFVVWMLFTPAPDNPSAGTILAEGLGSFPPVWAATWLAFRVVGAVVTVPLAEELAFRSYLTRRLIGPDFEGVPPGTFTWMSFLVSSIVFGAVHDSWIAGTLVGMMYAGIWYRRGEVIDAVVAHGVTNAFLAAWVLATRSWWLWA